MSNRLSSFIPLAPEITQTNIASQFPKDTIKVPLPEMTHSEKLEKAEFDTKERKKLAKEKEAMPGGQFPIRNQKDLENAIHDVGRSNNPGKAKSWIKKRAKELDCEDCLPGSWQKATEDELNMFNDELEKAEGSRGGKVIGHTKSGKPIYDKHDHPSHKDFDYQDHKDAKNAHKELIIKHGNEEEKHNIYSTNPKKKKARDSRRYHEEQSTMHGEKMMHLAQNDKTEKSLKTKMKKDMDGDGGGDEMEESVNKAFDSIFGEDVDPIEKAFEDLIGVETDSVEKAFNDVLKKGGPGSGKRIGMTRSGKKVYSDKYPHEYSDFSADDHTEAGTIHERAATKSKNDNKFRHHMGMDHSHSMLARKMRETIN